MKAPQTPSVAVLIDTATEWGRRLIRGIVNYAQQHGPWYLWVRPNVQSAPLRLPADWHGQGIIARVASPATARRVLAAKVPVVNVSTSQLPGIDLPRVTVDIQEAARLAARHFLDLGLHNFAYYGLQGYSYVKLHHQASLKCWPKTALRVTRTYLRGSIIPFAPARSTAKFTTMALLAADSCRHSYLDE